MRLGRETLSFFLFQNVVYYKLLKWFILSTFFFLWEGFFQSLHTAKMEKEREKSEDVGREAACCLSPGLSSPPLLS